ncbi:hypothetical protein GCM10025771_24380 [Niveibacterium umoris]|uniref:Transposase n=1 Tax=Niveibacterium umoris TaxID=1193620 RepID=A0A840BIB6_9RHOO|nr:hypothetical protein [Niveibacterium umoris]
MAHARRKFHELFAARKSLIAEEALRHFGVLCVIEVEFTVLDTRGWTRVRQ